MYWRFRKLRLATFGTLSVDVNFLILSPVLAITGDFNNSVLRT